MQMHLQRVDFTTTLAGDASLTRSKKNMPAQTVRPKLHHLHHSASHHYEVVDAGLYNCIGGDAGGAAYLGPPAVFRDEEVTSGGRPWPFAFATASRCACGGGGAAQAIELRTLVATLGTKPRRQRRAAIVRSA
jgi:hypothetical protein